MFESFSAGTDPKDKLNPDAVRLMREHYGIDMVAEGQRTKLLSELPEVDGVVTMGCGVQCPYVPSKWREDWGLPDPTGQEDSAFLRVMEEIREDIGRLKERLSDDSLIGPMSSFKTIICRQRN